MCCSSKSNAANSPLLRLPAEIRNIIFSYVYTVADYGLELDNDYGACHVVLSGPGMYLGEYEVHSFLVCRQVHVETALLPYELGRFIFMAQEWGSHLAVVGMRSFLERLSPRQLHATGKVTLWQYPVHHRL